MCIQNTVSKFVNFSAIQILCEIKSGEFTNFKNNHFDNFRGSEL